MGARREIAIHTEKDMRIKNRTYNNTSALGISENQVQSATYANIMKISRQELAFPPSPFTQCSSRFTPRQAVWAQTTLRAAGRRVRWFQRLWTIPGAASISGS